MAGILYLVATPIGNLGDFTPRAVETLENADFIAAEDTRVSMKLLNHFGVKKPLISYHEHNHVTAGQSVLNRLLAGESCALMTDAGTPAISDPGEDLVRLCAENGIDVIHAQYPRENVIAVLSRLWRRETRVMFTSHLTVRQSFLWRAVNRRITPYDAACIAVCTQGANLLRENGVKEEKIRVIFNGVAPKPLPPRRNVIRTEFSLPEDCFVFLTMARYAPEKGLFFLLDALAQLKERTDAPFACLIAGDGELFDAVGEGIREKGLDENVIRAGYRTDAEALMC